MQTEAAGPLPDLSPCKVSQKYQQMLHNPVKELVSVQLLGSLRAACSWYRYEGSQDAWEVVGRGQTNADGRVPDLLPPAAEVAPGTYR